MNIYRILLLQCLLLASSCSFNGTFHHSEDIPLAIDQMTHFNFGADTTYFMYLKDKQEILLANNDHKVINETYTIQSTFFKSSSGNLLNGWMLTPKNKKPIATILHFHGSAQNLLSHYSFIAPLIDFGYQIFTFDYSGYGFSEGKSTRDNALADAYSALNFVKGRSDVKNTKLIIYGQSYGGYLAAITGSNRQEAINGMVIEGAFSSHKDEARHKVPFFGNLVKEGITAKEEISKNRKPVLVIHSTEDKMVPDRFGKQIFESANAPKEFYSIDKGHINGLQYYAQEIAEKIQRLILDK